MNTQQTNQTLGNTRQTILMTTLAGAALGLAGCGSWGGQTEQASVEPPVMEPVTVFEQQPATETITRQTATRQDTSSAANTEQTPAAAGGGGFDPLSGEPVGGTLAVVSEWATAPTINLENENFEDDQFYGRSNSTGPNGDIGRVMGDFDSGFGWFDTSESEGVGGRNVSQESFALEGADFDPEVSPDGSFIVFASTQHSPASDLYIKTVGSRVVTQLTSSPGNEAMPEISPDGKRIAFASNRSGSWDIFVMPITGGKAVQITTSSSHELHPSWSSDGSELVFCRLGEMSGRWEIWITQVKNTGVAHFLGYGLFPEWCPIEGTGIAGRDRILFQKSRQRGDRAFSVWTMDYNNGEASAPTEIASSSEAACINPTWSPDGKWVVFATVPNPSQWATMSQSRPETTGLWMIDVDGGSRVNLTSGNAAHLMPAWAGSNRIYFISDRGGLDNIWSIDASSALLAATGEVPDDFANVPTDGN